MILIVDLVKYEEDLTDRTYQIQLSNSEDEKKRCEGYLLKFDSTKDSELFIKKSSLISSLSSGTHRTHDDNISLISNSERLPTKMTITSSIIQQSQMGIAEFSKLIIYCQGIKLKEYNINKASDLLG